MTDFQPQDAQPERTPQRDTPGTTTPLQAVPAKKPRRKLFIIIGALAVGLCLCMGIGGVTFGAGIFKVITERPRVEGVIHQFMIAMAAKDVAKAYTLFSTHSKKNDFTCGC